MNLSPRLLMKQLQKTYEVAHHSSLSTRGFLGRPLFLEPEKPLVKNRIYITNQPASYFSHLEFSSSCFLLVLTESSIPTESYPMPIAFIHTSDSSEQVGNVVQNIFDLYDEWESTLMGISLVDGSVQSLLNASYPILGNPLRVVSMDFSIVASVNAQTQTDHPSAFHETAEYLENVTALKQDTLYNAVREKDGAFLFPDHLTGYRSLNVNIKRFSQTSHRLSLMELDGPLLEGSESLLEFLATLIEHALLHNTTQRSSKDKNLHSIFLSILSDRTADYMLISQQLSSMNWLESHEYLCMVLQITSLDQKNLTENAICNYLENIFSDACAIPFKNDIVLFFNLTKSGNDIDSISEKIIYFIRDSFLKTGYSRSMIGHLNLRRQYTQACIALDFGIQKNPYLWSHHFNKIALPYIYEEITKKLPSYMICHEKLLVLREMDCAQNTEYIKTLRIYLDHHLNAVQSAKELFIHRSTFLYRLDKIKAVLESDLDDADELLYLMLSLRLIEQSEQKSPSNEQ